MKRNEDKIEEQRKMINWETELINRSALGADFSDTTDVLSNRHNDTKMAMKIK